ncbi:unnamed protein product [Phytophthora fragariaefolia]|uniref:Unnamed protein product n=1 Tax=Phytophthora fragariaefolia TaxID=1490495 RepID=A0A9W6WWW4_9STRA|nr:unnamed protein product [Phytophthora fragariaefolia]
MPIGAVLSDNSKISAGRISSPSLSAAQEMESQHKPGLFEGQPALRLVASEKFLNSTIENSSPVTTFEACPSVTCDVASDDSSDDSDLSHRSSYRSTTRRGENQLRGSRRTSNTVQKVRPGDHEDEEEEMIISSTSARVATDKNASCDVRDDFDTEINVQDAAPVLKGFFSKSVSVSKEQRELQREQRRELIYRESKLRQNKLREQAAREREADVDLNRRRKVEQLRRLNQQRRVELLRDAAGARKKLLERIQEDNDTYLAERERWENDFEDEMQILSRAFRKAHTSDENRPMTVAGLAVPEAMSQLERDASNFEKRVKTAQPALSSMSPHPRRTQRPGTTEGTPSIFDAEMASSPFFDFCEALPLEDSQDVFDLFGDDQKSDPFAFYNSVEASPTQQPNRDIDRLLREREKLLQRLAAIDQMVQTQQ